VRTLAVIAALLTLAHLALVLVSLTGHDYIYGLLRSSISIANTTSPASSRAASFSQRAALAVVASGTPFDENDVAGALGTVSLLTRRALGVTSSSRGLCEPLHVGLLYYAWFSSTSRPSLLAAVRAVAAARRAGAVVARLRLAPTWPEPSGSRCGRAYQEQVAIRGRPTDSSLPSRVAKWRLIMLTLPLKLQEE
jgi:hypothetical protein